MDLFEGNAAGYGKHTYTGEDRKSWSVTGKVTRKDFTSHLEGKEGIGIVPIRQDNKCLFGCIDYDIHHNGGPQADLIDIEARVSAQKLPLVVCRSHGGGAHLWAFFVDPIQATLVKKLLTMWSRALGIFDEAEIFPKQSYLIDGSVGNTINIPYFDSNNTKRYAIHEGNELTFKEFLALCDKRSIYDYEVDKHIGGEHHEAPPCLQSIMEKGSDLGNRNETMYNMTIYLKRRNPDTFRDDAIDINSAIFKRPLPMRELRRTITSAARKEYKYRCNESPCRDFCNKEVCLTMKYGLSADEMELDNSNLFGKLIKHNTDPVQWVLTVNGRNVSLNTHTLMDHRRLMEAVADETTMIIPTMKPNEWMRMLADLMQNAEEQAAPEDATIGGQLMGKLWEFVRRARPPEESGEGVAREALHRGQPVAEINEDGQVIVHFRGKDFIEFLKRNRFGDVRGATIWMNLRKQGIVSGKIRVNGKTTMAVWSVAAAVDDNSQIVPQIKASF